MNSGIYSVITGTGSYVPSVRVRNEDFIGNEFFDTDGSRLEKAGEEIIEKFQAITTIAERRYVTPELVTSDIGFFAAREAITSAGIDQEELDYIILAHNFGDVQHNNRRSDIVPSLAARIKHKLGIKNPNTVAYDITFGCPGWLQGVIQADYFIKSGDAKKVLVIGAEVLSRVCDPHDRDSMIYADGAGATVLEARTTEQPTGILTHKTRSDTYVHSQMLRMGGSYNPALPPNQDLYLKMNGRKLYQYALETIPQAIKACLEKVGIPLTAVKHLLIHQANGKMDDAILKRLFTLYGIEEVPPFIMPMTIAWLGNSSVATLPTLLDMILTNQLKPYELVAGDIAVFASVGAGMNINTVIYRM